MSMWRFKRRGRELGPVLGTLVVLSSLVGCEAAFSPVTDTGRPYTLWGALDPDGGQQALRVVPINLQLDIDGDTEASAIVTSEALATGDVVTWRDSVVTYANGSNGLIYLADFQPDYGTRYRITATRSDGAATTAYVEIPALVDPLVFLPEGGSGNLTNPVAWLGAPRLNAAEVTYLIRDAGCTTLMRTLALDPVFVKPSKYGWTTDIPLSQHSGSLTGELGQGLSILQITVRTLVTDPEWKPPFGFDFDPEVTVEPGTVSNVENGFGFVGAAYTAEANWSPTDETLSLLGLVTRAGTSCGG